MGYWAKPTGTSCKTWIRVQDRHRSRRQTSCCGGRSRRSRGIADPSHSTRERSTSTRGKSAIRPRSFWLRSDTRTTTVITERQPSFQRRMILRCRGETCGWRRTQRGGSKRLPLFSIRPIPLATGWRTSIRASSTARRRGRPVPRKSTPSTMACYRSGPTATSTCCRRALGPCQRLGFKRSRNRRTSTF